MTEETPTDGVISDYNDMTQIPIIKYNSTNNSLIFDNPVQTSSGIASTELAPLSFNLPAVFNNGISAGGNADFSQYVPIPLPSDPMTLNIPPEPH